MIQFVVNHPPVGQPRHRVSTIGGHARMYLPTRHPVHDFKRAVRAAFGSKAKCIIGTLEVTIDAWFARPKAMVWKTKPMNWEFHGKKPDVDNVAKSVLDALNGLAWADDAQISVLTVSKYICHGGDAPHVKISIRSIER